MTTTMAVCSNPMTLGSCLSPQDVMNYISKLLQDSDDVSWVGTFTSSLYDSAWLSMVHRREDGRLSWIFPQCFTYVMSCQLENGSWPSYASSVDGILNTSAGLLALLTRRHLSQDTCLSAKIDSATRGLNLLLQAWDVDEMDQVGFEVIIPSLLRQISQFGIHFSFPGQRRLDALSATKLEKLRPELLYSDRQSTILHSLESLIGIVDFDRMSHHCSEARGLLGSPASTAAYLMNSSNWDVRAESYLQKVVASSGSGSGGVPSGFPTSIFELSWALSTFFMAIGPPSQADTALLSPIRDYLQKTLDSQNGVAGFASGILADADDTARALMTLESFGVDVKFGPMIEYFKAGLCFKTYEFERNPSFSANCNVLLAFVSSKNAQMYIDDIERITAYLLEVWKAGNIKDKWNSSPHYSTMLLSLAIIRLLQRYDKGDLVGPCQASLSSDIVICLSQILTGLLADQREDGSWDASVEVTAYCVLTVSEMMHLPFHEDVQNTFMSPAVSRGGEYIIKHQQDPIRPRREDYLWIEKLSYSSSLLRRVYTIAAIHTSRAPAPCTKALAGLFEVSATACKMMGFLLSTPLFKDSPPPFTELALLEASHWSRQLHDTRSSIFTDAGRQKGDQKLFDLIPLVFTTCNQRMDLTLSTHAIWEMIHISLLVYQVDELMESTAIHMTHIELTEIRDRLWLSCSLRRKIRLNHSASNGTTSAEPLDFTESRPVKNTMCRDEYCGFNSEHSAVDNLFCRLQPFIRHVLHHPKVQQAPSTLQHELAHELYRFLSSHVEHVGVNIRLRERRGNPTLNGLISTSQNTYYQWVHSIGAADTSCPLASLFFTCLISEPGRFSFEDTQSQYVTRTVIRHLSAMCRQYNDYGSAARDLDEGNLNSLDFLDGLVASPTASSNGVRGKTNGQRRHVSLALKKQLIEIAEFERSCMQLALERLSYVTTSSDALKRLRVFVDVTDMFGQVYVLKDLTSRIHQDT